jgi:enamine deaminase RidA (YjgF/YER057c/UK114 family)
MSSKIELRLRELGLELPALPPPGGNYIPARTVGSMVYLSGVVSTDESGIVTGMVGVDRTVQEGYAAARLCALMHLAFLQKHLGSLDLVKQVVTLTGYVNSAAGFRESPDVINGASDVLVEVFGEAGRHARLAIGVSGLPRYAMVETQMTVEI